MQEIAQGRGKTVPQVNSIFLVLSVSRLCCVFQACGGHGVARQPWITARLVHFVFCELSIGQSQVPMYRCKRCAGSHPVLTGTGVPVSCLLLSGLHTSPHFVVFNTLPCKHHTGCQLLMSTYFGIHTHVCFQDSASAEWEKGEMCSDELCDTGETVFLLS